ncbi:MAG: cyclic nucleotide-binding domain-containing protein [Desulfohalobiaceae bacterium]|nr:cyclic nucleotide-binding domain-containing protein [Desulfohalobiaceae bacterium]
MVDIEELRQVLLLQDLSDKELEKIGAVAEIEEVDPETVLFRENRKLETFYMLLRGRVLLSCRSPAGVSLTLGEVRAGSSFGVSSFIAGTRSSTSAFSVEFCRIITVPGGKLSALFEDDPRLGYRIMLRVVQLFQNRMNQRTDQFLNSLAGLPAVKSALSR